MDKEFDDRDVALLMRSYRDHAARLDDQRAQRLERLQRDLLQLIERWACDQHEFPSIKSTAVER